MAELAPLSILITADADDLTSELAKAKAQLAGFEAQAAKAGTKATGLAGSFGKLTSAGGNAQAAIRNTSFQLQDIAVQLSMGTRASTVMAQQLPQLAGGFAMMGGNIGLAASALGVLAW